MENNNAKHGPLFNVWHSSMLKSLSIEFRGEISTLIENDFDAVRQKAMLMPYYGRFIDCMARQGFVYFENPDDQLNRGYNAFHGTAQEIYFRFLNEQLGDNSYTCEISAMDFDEVDYTDLILKQKWDTIAQGLYNAILSYFNDSECAAPAAAPKNVAPAAAAPKNVAPAAAPKAVAPAAAPAGAAAALEEPYYNTNENVEMPVFGNLKLRALSENNIQDVEHNFAICYKNPAHATVVEAGDSVVLLKHLDFIIKAPASALAYQNIMCQGVNPGYVATSMDNSDIIIMLVETTNNYADTFIAGILTLKVKPSALEIDLICSNIGYKMAGIMLMSKAMRAARLLGLEKIELASVHTPETLRFYKRLGFKKVTGNNFAQSVKAKGLLPYRRRLTRKVHAPAGAAAGAGAAAPVLKAAQVKALFDKAVEKAGAAVVKPEKNAASNNALWAKQNALWAKAGKARKTRRLRKK